MTFIALSKKTVFCITFLHTSSDMAHRHVPSASLTYLHPLLFPLVYPGYCVPAAIGAALAGRSRGEDIVSIATVGDGSFVQKKSKFS